MVERFFGDSHTLVLERHATDTSPTPRIDTEPVFPPELDLDQLESYYGCGPDECEPKDYEQDGSNGYPRLEGEFSLEDLVVLKAGPGDFPVNGDLHWLEEILAEENILNGHRSEEFCKEMEKSYYRCKDAELDAQYVWYQEFLESQNYTPEEHEWLWECLEADVEEESHSLCVQELSDQEYQRELEELYYQQGGPLDMRFELMCNPVAEKCDYKVFVSRSKGKGRRRKHHTEVELVYYCGRWFLLKDGSGPFDGIATEVFGDTVEPEEAETKLLESLRKLPELKQKLAAAIAGNHNNGNGHKAVLNIHKRG